MSLVVCDGGCETDGGVTDTCKLAYTYFASTNKSVPRSFSLCEYRRVNGGAKPSSKACEWGFWGGCEVTWGHEQNEYT